MTAVSMTLVSFFISAAAFFHGAVETFKKGVPMYFQLMVCPAGCFALRELWRLVNSLCGNPDGVNIGLFGFMGCFLFLLSANYGQLDSFVDDGTYGKTYRNRALAAPAVLVMLTMILFFVQGISSIYLAAVEVIILIPAYAGAFFHLKHLLLPVDDFGFLLASRWCNVSSLLFYIIYMIYMFFMRELSFPAYVADLLMCLVMTGIVISSERGYRTWKSLI